MTGSSQDQDQDRGTRLRADFGVAWGLLAGAGVGTILLALTGEAVWMVVGPGVGLVVGAVVAALGAGQRDDATTPEEDQVP